MGRDHSCEVCGQGGFNGGECVCTTEEDARRAVHSESQGRELRERARRLLGEQEREWTTYVCPECKRQSHPHDGRCPNDVRPGQFKPHHMYVTERVVVVPKADRDSLQAQLDEARGIIEELAAFLRVGNLHETEGEEAAWEKATSFLARSSPTEGK